MLYVYVSHMTVMLPWCFGTCREGDAARNEGDTKVEEAREAATQAAQVHCATCGLCSKPNCCSELCDSVMWCCLPC